MSSGVELKFCLRCRMSRKVCYCEWIEPFESGPLIATLVHPKENRKRIGTNRIVKLTISNSLRFEGTGEMLDHNGEIERLLKSPAIYPTVLYPGKNAVNIDTDPSLGATGRALQTTGRRLLVFVIDATWDLAQQMLHRSEKLKALPQLMFEPQLPSNYRIRRQPHPVCLSTVEAVYALLSRLDATGRYPVAPITKGALSGQGQHAHLLTVFNLMVERQLNYQRLSRYSSRQQSELAPASEPHHPTR